MNPLVTIKNMRRNDQTWHSAWVWCPGCESAHAMNIDGEGHEVWGFNGDLEKPTFSPSILSHSSVHRCPKNFAHYDVCLNPDTCGKPGHAVLGEDDGHRILGHMLPHKADPPYGNCHSFIENGQWRFLGDSAHELAGQTVDMVPIPDWLCDYDA